MFPINPVMWKHLKLIPRFWKQQIMILNSVISSFIADFSEQINNFLTLVLFSEQSFFYVCRKMRHIRELNIHQRWVETSHKLLNVEDLKENILCGSCLVEWFKFMFFFFCFLERCHLSKFEKKKNISFLKKKGTI